MTRLAGGRARSPVEEPRGGNHRRGSHGQLGFEQPHVFDFRGGHDGAEDGEQGDGPAGDGAEPFAGLPGAGEDVEERQEAGDHHEGNQGLVGGAHGVAELNGQQEKGGERTQGDDGDVGRAPSRMHLAEGRGEQVVDTGRKGHTGDGGAQSAELSDGAGHDEERDQRGEPGQTEGASGALAGFGEAVHLADLAGRQDDEEGDGSGGIEDGSEGGGDPAGARQGARGVADLGAHESHGFEAAHGIGDGGPEADGVPVPGGSDVDGGGGAAPAKKHGGHGDQQGAEEPGGGGADTLGPLADLHADEVGAECDPDGDEGNGVEERAAGGQVRVRGSEGVNAGAHVEHGGAGEPEGNADPVDDEAEEAVPAAEIVARPEIDAAGAGILHGEGGDGDGERHHEEQGGEEPEGDGAGPGVGGGGNPAGADDAGDGEEGDVAQAEYALQLRGMVRHAGVRTCRRVR